MRRLSSRPGSAAGLALVVLLASCEAFGVNECTSTVNVQVAAGAQPVFDWQPACGVQEITVYDGQGGVVWGINRDNASIRPPVRYGVVPGSAVEMTEPAALVEGETYEVYLMVGGPGMTLHAFGGFEFVHSP